MGREAAKFILVFLMLILGICHFLIPAIADNGGNITGYIWLVGAILLAWMPTSKGD